MLVFGVFPPLDLALGMDARNPPDSVIKWLEQDRYYRWCTYLYLPHPVRRARVRLLAVVARTPLGGRQGRPRADRGDGQRHRHQHRARARAQARPSIERWLSRVALAQSGYGHFFIEHNRGHHVRVATPEDPASARLGESFYAFLPRTVIGSLRSAWELERVRLARLAHPWSPRNDILGAWAMTVVLFAALVAGFGLVVLPYLLIQAVIGFSLLEVVNYLEHYGLLRQRREDGRYERTRPEHSWNSNNVASNVLLYHLQRHSDHHANPIRRYQALRHVDDAPQLPTGYAGMILLAVIPPLWRRVMDHRVLAHYAASSTAPTSSPAAPPGARALRPSAAAAQPPRAAAEPLPLPGLRLRLRRAARAPARGLPARHRLERGARRLGLPGLRGAR